MAKNKSNTWVGTALVSLEEEVRHKEVIYVDVKIGGELLCSLSSSDVPAFLEDFKKLVKDYKI